MPPQLKAIALDVDTDTIKSLRQAFPEWEIELTNEATLGVLPREWNPGRAELLIVGSCDEPSETVGLCRLLRGQLGRVHTPLLVIVRPGEESLVRASLAAGADSCLVLPVHPKDLASTLARALAGNQPGRHTLIIDRAQIEDVWRDEGGEA